MLAADLARRRHLLLVMLAATRFRYPPDQVPELVRLLRGWFSSWLGIGRIVVGMTRQGFDLQLTQYDREGWRATFYPEGRAHSVTPGGGVGGGADAVGGGDRGGGGDVGESGGWRAMKMAIGLLSLVAGLAACAPLLGVTSVTPRSVSVCHDPYLKTHQEAADLAEEKCQENGLHARAAGEGRCGVWGGMTLTIWHCVP
jgi:hypothetical protein